MNTEKRSDVIREAEILGYPYRSDLETGCRFYEDEAYIDGVQDDCVDPWEQHPNACGCDTCDNPAKYMTFPDGGDGETCLYICTDCVKRFKLESLVDDKETRTTKAKIVVMEMYRIMTIKQRQELHMVISGDSLQDIINIIE